MNSVMSCKMNSKMNNDLDCAINYEINCEIIVLVVPSACAPCLPNLMFQPIFPAPFDEMSCTPVFNLTCAGE